MVEPAELRPEELDRLEDALELLEVADADDPSPAVRHRLGDFRKILQLSRSVLPMVDVPHGILDRVIAEARQAAEVPSVAPVLDPPPATQPLGFWAKMRRFALLPGVALAGAAALVLLMVERSPEHSVSSGELRDEIARVDAKSAAADEDRARFDAMPAREQAEAPPPPTAGALAPGVRSEAAAVPAAPAPTTATTPVPEPAAVQEKSKSELADMPEKKSAEEEDSPADIGDGGTPRWDIIARGDRARHKGNCGAARTEYKLALGDADARVRARAHAGIGLCSAVEGQPSAADSAYKAARELDPEISGFIDSERPRGAGTGSSNAARASKKAKPAQQQVEPANAFDPKE
jgi:hypothetical protein